MNILFTEMVHHNLQWQIKLVEDGHTVYTNQVESEHYLKSLNIHSIHDIPYHIFASQEIIKPEDIVELTNELPLLLLERLEQQ